MVIAGGKRVLWWETDPEERGAEENEGGKGGEDQADSVDGDKVH